MRALAKSDLDVRPKGRHRSREVPGRYSQWRPRVRRAAAPYRYFYHEVLGIILSSGTTRYNHAAQGERFARSNMANSSRQHIQTVAAIILCLILVVPFTFLVSVVWSIGGGTLPTSDLSVTWLPWPLDVFFVRWLGSALLGLTAGVLSMLSTQALLRQSSPTHVAYGAASIIATLTLILVVVVGLGEHNFIDRVPSLLQGVGSVIGIAGAAHELHRKVQSK